jgi:uncharacterized delta-60 repeat protein
VAVGEADNASGADLMAVRYQEHGALDPSFSGDGKLTVNLGGEDGAWDVQLLDGGTILAAGWSNTNSQGRVALVWISSSGTLDHDFGGGDGKAIVHLLPNDHQENARAAFVLGSGEILVVGEADAAAGGGKGDVFVARLKPNGDRDTSFGGGDGVVESGAAGDQALFGARRTQGGQIVAAGFTVATDFRFLVVRLRPDGTLDPAFGTNGFATPFPGESRANDVEVLSDGRILATGDVHADVATVRLKG